MFPCRQPLDDDVDVGAIHVAHVICVVKILPRVTSDRIADIVPFVVGSGRHHVEVDDGRLVVAVFAFDHAPSIVPPRPQWS